MAEVLVKIRDASNRDATKDAYCYKRGDPVVVMPDGWSWGREEGPPNFIVVKIPGVDAGKLRRYIEPDADADSSVMRRRRKFCLLLDEVPQVMKSRIAKDGSVTVTWNQIRDYVRDKVSGALESGRNL